MYKALKSFTTADYQIQLGQILDDNFITEDEIQDLLNADYIRAYNTGEDGIKSNTVYTIWTGTEEQYSAITTLDDNTLYFIEEE